MRALSVRQPWAWAILNAGKDIENRDWPTNVRGTVAVHASKTFSRREYYDYLRFTGESEQPTIHTPPFYSFELGAILGTVDIVDCVQHSDSKWFVGEYGFVLKNPRRCYPIYGNGKLGFWPVPPDLVSLIKYVQ